MKGWFGGRKQITVSISSQAKSTMKGLNKNVRQQCESIIAGMENAGTDYHQNQFKKLGREKFSARVSDGWRMEFERISESEISLSLLFVDVEDHNKYNSWWRR